MHSTLRAALMAAVLVGASLPAAAQSRPWEEPWEDRVFGGISFGVEGGGADVTDNRTFTIYEEDGTLLSNTNFGADSIVDFTVGARVWRNMGVALAFHAKSSTGSGDVQGSIPHPIFFDRQRTFSQPLDGIDRDEKATHLQFGWMLPFNDRFDVFVYVGPSFFRLSQEVVDDVEIGEQGPPFATVVASPFIQNRKATATGYNLGADATYILYTRDRMRLGVGGFLRLTGATADLRLSNSTIETDLGGLQFGVGARVRF